MAAAILPPPRSKSWSHPSRVIAASAATDARRSSTGPLAADAHQPLQIKRIRAAVRKGPAQDTGTAHLHFLSNPFDCAGLLADACRKSGGGGIAQSGIVADCNVR